MADNILFEVDASQIIAKLHLAAQQQANPILSKGFIVNTGIVDNDPKGTPENIGKVRFDLNNKNNQFQLGAVVDIAYTKVFDVDKELKALKDVGVDRLNKKIDIKEDGEFIKKKEEVIKLCKDNNVPGFEDDKNIDKTFAASSADEFIKNMDILIKAFNKQQDEKDGAINKELAAKKNIAAEALRTYLQNFAGKDNVDNFNDRQIGMIEISSTVKDSTDKNLVKMYEIQKITDQEKGKLLAQAKQNAIKNPNKPNCFQKVCFYVLYSLDVNK